MADEINEYLNKQLIYRMKSDLYGLLAKYDASQWSYFKSVTGMSIIDQPNMLPDQLPESTEKKLGKTQKTLANNKTKQSEHSNTIKLREFLENRSKFKRTSDLLEFLEKHFGIDLSRSNKTRAEVIERIIKEFELLNSNAEVKLAILSELDPSFLAKWRNVLKT